MNEIYRFSNGALSGIQVRCTQGEGKFQKQVLDALVMAEKAGHLNVSGGKVCITKTDKEHPQGIHFNTLWRIVIITEIKIGTNHIASEEIELVPENIAYMIEDHHKSREEIHEFIKRMG